MPAAARALAEAFWPGPLDADPAASCARARRRDRRTGQRRPARAGASGGAGAARGVRRRGIAAPSANRFGHVSPTTAQHVAADLGDEVALILDGGACDDRHREHDRRVSRRRADAAASRRHRRRRSGTRPRPRVVRTRQQRAPRVRHARRRTTRRARRHRSSRRMRCAPSSRNSSIATRASRCWRARSRDRKTSTACGCDAARDARDYAHDLYANLRELDARRRRRDPDRGRFRTSAEWLAVRDRLMRATHGDDDDRD